MIRKIEGLYFCADYGASEITERIVTEIADRLDKLLPEKLDRACFDIPLHATKGDLDFDCDSLVVICVPVIKNRVPLPCVRLLQRLHSNGSMAVAVINYKGASYGQTLFNLYSFLEGQGFNVISAAAFVSHPVRGRVFSKLEKTRPDEKDLEKFKTFGALTTSKVKRLIGTEVDCLKVKPAPLDIACKSALVVSVVHIVKRREPEWFL